MTSPAWDPSMPHQLNTAVWIGQGGNLEIKKTIQFRTNTKYFTTKVVLKNVGSTTMFNVEYMRNVDPDQGQPHGCGYSTNNYVKYDPVDRPKTVGDNTALVIAKGLSSCSNMVCGLGTVHANARVNHFGFRNDDADAVVGASRIWHGATESSPKNADEGINLAYRFDTLEAGSSVSFAFAYVLSETDLNAAMVEYIFCFCVGFPFFYFIKFSNGFSFN